MSKKFFILVTLLIMIFSFFTYRTFALSYKDNKTYEEKWNNINNIYIKGASAPRGRILDIKGRVIVDNIGENTIFYHKPDAVSLDMEIDIAKKLANLTNYEYTYDEAKLKDYFLLLYPDVGNSLISENEQKLLNERKLTKDDITNLKKEKLTPDILNTMSSEEKYSSYFYYLMNEGYMYDNKLLLKNVPDKLYAKILESNLPGIFGELTWTRYYPYGETLRSILGTISNNLPEEKTDLLEKGYSLTDKVGTSGLEEYYESYLKGEKATYKVENNNLVLVSKAKRGKDLVLEIDMDIELKVETVLKEQIEAAKKTPNTEYLNESYALVSNPKTGAIIAISGMRRISNNKKTTYQDVSINVIKNAYAPGSVVKGASMTVGYQNKVIDIGTTMLDSCVKLAFQPAKCSWTRLGTINDISALRESSNYYQFIIALGVAGYKYHYNMEAPVTIDDFNKYRDTFATFGLGTTTGIDLPGETSGLKGDIIAPDLLMNLAIGQYDLYTPVSLLQYINTIASDGKRLKLNLMHSIKDEETEIVKNKVTILDQVDIDPKYLKRIQSGFRSVITSGTGYYYVNQNVNAAGKTGTSEVYIDSDYNGTLDAYVLNTSFIMYAPVDNPKYSIVVISPNSTNLDGNSSYQSGVNRLIARNINDYLFSSP